MTEISLAAREHQPSVDETGEFCPKFDPNGLIPAMAIDAHTREPLMLAWMNEEALLRTLQIGEAVYYSRSRKELWHKGATSGHTQTVLEIRTDCDQDVILMKVEQVGPGCCHVGYRSCFYRKVDLADKIAAPDDSHIVQLEFSAEKTYNPDEVY